VKIMLDPPRTAITIPATAPSMGPTDAPIVIVEWSDYQCPFCKRAAPTLNQVLNEYKGKVRFVFRDYPLPFHKQAMPRRSRRTARETRASTGSTTTTCGTWPATSATPISPSAPRMSAST
jgi:protein-disulfide isomerase